ncbi:zinc ribbon domain-containing protein [Haloferax namakaokahaiae]|uniref:Zinc ribbon domain-containing protein n=1 Tax=Haloferax namakaokahaiae TaxID=1748331 RepID=A0ABD5ZAS5_9EURY
MEVELRLLLAGFCIVAPSLLFVGFVRLLDGMREGDFVERVLDRLDDDISETGTAVDPTLFLRTAQEKSRQRMLPCGECGAPNVAGSARCGLCGMKLRS